jgi:predicted permease
MRRHGCGGVTLMSDILNLALPFFGLILLGVVAARRWQPGEQGLAWLNIFVIYFALPALIFQVVADAPVEELANWPYLLATTSVTTVAFFIVMLLSRVMFGTAWRTAVLQGTAGSYGNVGYMGLPLAVAFFGPEAAVPAALVFCCDCTLHFVLAPLLATLAQQEEDTHWRKILWRIVRQVMTHPFIIATVLGVVASALHLTAPGAVNTLLDMLMKAAGPAALFALGVTVGLRRFAGTGPELMLVSGMKIFLQPAMAFIAVSLIPGITPLWLHVAVMMAALPTASNAFILASQYRSYTEGASAAVIVTTLLSAITVPLLIYAIGAGLLP